LPSLRFETETVISRDISYPVKPISIGDHIRKKRMDLKLLQKDVAQILNVSEDCVTYWENNRNKPQIKYYPQIIKFLDYSPFEIDLSTFKGKLRAYRFLNGLSQKRCANIMNIDPKTLIKLESGNGNLNQIIKIKKFLRNYDFKIDSLYRLESM